MELREYLTIVRRWWWLLLLGAVLGGGAGYFAGQYKIPLYQSQTTLMIGRFIQSANPNPGEVATGLRLAQSYADLTRREPILRDTIAALELELDWTELQKTVSARPVLDTQLLEISITDTNPRRAKLIADEITRQLILQSPTSEVDEDQEAYQAFVKTQLATLQTNITEAQQQLQELQAALEIETTGRGIQRRQDELEALQSKLNTWQSNYASLLSFTQATEKKVNILTVIEPAPLPAKPINATAERDTALAALVGLMLAAGVVFLLEYLDDTIKTAEDVQWILGLNTLGSIPKITSRRRGKSRGQIAASLEAFSPVAEAYRVLRTNIQFSSLILTNPATTLLVTSSGDKEGKSTTVANLAIVIAQSGKRVILVDTDLRRPTLHKLFDVPNEIGLTGLLLDKELSLETALQPTAIDNLRLLPSGPLPPNAADLVASEPVAQLIPRLAEQADLVIFDSPPLLAVADASILATRVGATLLVIEAAQTRSQVCLRGKEILEQVGVSPLGVVLNRFNPKGDAYYRYGYYNYYPATENGRGPHEQPDRVTDRHQV